MNRKYCKVGSGSWVPLGGVTGGGACYAPPPPHCLYATAATAAAAVVVVVVVSRQRTNERTNQLRRECTTTTNTNTNTNTLPNDQRRTNEGQRTNKRTNELCATNDVTRTLHARAGGWMASGKEGERKGRREGMVRTVELGGRADWECGGSSVALARVSVLRSSGSKLRSSSASQCVARDPAHGQCVRAACMHAAGCQKPFLCLSMV